MMPSGIRQLALTTHVTASVGWLGSVAALFALLAATTLSIYKPWGLTAYGQRQLAAPANVPTSILWTRSALLTALALLVLFVIWHLASGGMHGH